ncbi:hypothetical protein B0A48_08420 [Cryoendolithus antarcticus]|uniref:VOC domain-containing protein n=1 Tax=Cryoendolithus antarcticus TaxID=1507870 RepID=A0A1V8T5E2_9PEZI|nr:hypothetical protein B0A48_08420 [Cryoendolithus antarcticus]
MADTSPSNGTAAQHGQDRPVTITGADGSKTTVDLRPNAGASIPDKEAIGDESEPLATWYKKSNIDPSARVQIVKLAHMRYQHPDLEEITTFLRDFGMHIAKRTETEIWYRGYGPDQYVYYAVKGEKKFLGGTFEVESEAELEKASRIPGAGKIEDLSDAPGGGKLLILRDPEGFLINLLYGQTPVEKSEYPQKVIYNFESPEDKPRVRKFNRFTPGPAAVHKLGHYGLCVLDFPKQLQWYTQNFNLAPTDFLYIPLPDEASKGASGKATKDVAAFLHIDRGADPVDHHTFFMSGNKTAHVHHCSFEVHDYDTQHLGHQWLAGKGYTSVWGIGRHILGSQLFDYWWDTTGNMIEHYADGDLVNEDTPVGWGSAGDESLAVWGPEVPSWFLH